MHTVHSSVGSFCTIICVICTWQCPCTQRWFHRILQFSMQVPTMLGFSSPSFTFTFKYGHHGWHPHCQHVPLCKDKAASTVDDKGKFCKLSSTECRHSSDYTHSNMANCQVCFITSSVALILPCQVLHVSNCVLIDPTLWLTPPCD